MKKPTILKKLDPFHSMEVLFPEYLEYFHTTKNHFHTSKIWKLDFPTFFFTIFTIFYNILQYFTIKYFHTMEKVQIANLLEVTSQRQNLQKL